MFTEASKHRKLRERLSALLDAEIERHPAVALALGALIGGIGMLAVVGLMACLILLPAAL